ncbi:MAG: hypothetical protein CMH55_03780 [Myxococcales bacterium]|nr:hypothetical protein [Myxococcales bacterium]
MKEAIPLLSLTLLAACAPQSVRAPSLAVDCTQIACRANQVCVAGACVTADGGIDSQADAGSSVVPPNDAGVGPAPEDAGQPPAADAGTVVVDPPDPGGDGSRRDRAARSCQDLLANFPDTESDDYWIDPDGEDGPTDPVRLYCGMQHDVGGWTQVARLMYGDEVWDAWNDDQGSPGSGNRSWGVPLRLFSETEDGQDLEIIVAAAETSQGDYYVGPIYGDVHRRAWQPGEFIEEEIDDGFYYREEDGENQRCEADLWRRNEQWSWAISRGQSGCAGWSGGGGFVIYGSEQQPERAYSLWGLYAFGSGNRGARFGAVDLFVKRR